jgi:opacity protein-like surface antigen
MLRRALLVVAVAVSVSVAAVAQESNSAVSLNLTGVFGKTSTANGIDQSPTKSAGLLLNCRHMLTNHHGFDLNYGYTRNSQNYFSSTNKFGIQSGVHELTGAYVFTAPSVYRPAARGRRRSARLQLLTSVDLLKSRCKC